MFPKLFDFLTFIISREKIRLLKDAGAPRPWSQDTVFNTYRFCNVRREDDTVTKWVRNYIREPFADHPNLWVMLCLARQINHPETLAELLQDKKAWPYMKLDNWDLDKLRWAMIVRQGRGEKIYTGAYMLNCNWGAHYDGPRDKPAFTAHRVLHSVVHGAQKFRVQEALTEGTCQAVADALASGHGWGGFMAAQVVADLKYTRYLKDAPDWQTFALSGPGSRKGLNVVMGNEPEHQWQEAAWKDSLLALQKHVNRVLLTDQSGPHPHKDLFSEPLHAQDAQNCLCEFYKYSRGYSRTKYVPAEELK
jgi:hypothetical protein